jgi:hypothetical protein
VLAALAAAASRLDRAGVPWRLAGGTGRLLLGMHGRPSDVDIEVAAADAARAADALGLPSPTPIEGSGWWSLRSQGTLAGIELDLSGGLRVEGPGGVLQADDADAVTVRFGGGTVRVETPGESLARAVVSGDAAREQRAREQLPAQPAAALAYAELRVAAAASAAR